MSLLSRLAPPETVRVPLVFVLCCVLCALLLTDYRALGDVRVREGEVAEHDVVAPFSMPFVDISGTSQRQAEAEAAVPPIYDADLTTGKQLENRVSQAFDMARRRLGQARLDAVAAGKKDPPAEVVGAIGVDFSRMLDLTLAPAELAALSAEGYTPAVEELTIEFISVAMRRYVVADKGALPNPARPILVVTPLGDERDETLLEDYGQIRSPEEARQAITLYVVERFAGARSTEAVNTAAGIARALVRPNLSYNALLTTERRRAAREAVGKVEGEIRKGTRVVRAGDTVTARQALLVTQLQAADRHVGRGWRTLAWGAFTAILIGVAVRFARGTIRKFSTRTQDLSAMAVALVLVLFLGRLIVSSGRFLDLPEAGAVAALALLVPVAGGAVLVRILINSESALLWSVVASVLAAAQADQSVLLAGYHLVASLAATAAVGQARERLAVLRAGAIGGLVGAAFVLLMTLLRTQVLDAERFSWERLAGDALVATASGALCAVLVLGIAPAFELLGFVTDAKLLELSNLNHPLLRQLMLRAPGTYHHSVIVGSLSEAACETIGANALLARVACYFHDIGKGLKPQYFVENQREVQNRHDKLSPEQSAAVIIGHVRDGAALAAQYKLPRPIVDNIYMHHGTGLIQYFHSRAREQAEGQTVDESLFRYPGPKPNSREAGVIMLADKVEAACRTIREPTEERLRAMIQTIISSVMNDGQFEDCPLTLRELYQIGDTFTAVLLGIYHHRIEYPTTAAISSGKAGKPRFIPAPRQGTITLEIVNPLRPAAPSPTGDYEAVDIEERRRSPDVDDA